MRWGSQRSDIKGTGGHRALGPVVCTSWPTRVPCHDAVGPTGAVSGQATRPRTCSSAGGPEVKPAVLIAPETPPFPRKGQDDLPGAPPTQAPGAAGGAWAQCQGRGPSESELQVLARGEEGQLDFRVVPGSLAQVWLPQAFGRV